MFLYRKCEFAAISFLKNINFDRWVHTEFLKCYSMSGISEYLASLAIE